MAEFLEGLVRQSVDRGKNRILDIESYIEERRRTIGAKLLFSIVELGFHIPDRVMSHPVIQEMTLAAIDMIACCNVGDIYKNGECTVIY